MLAEAGCPVVQIMELAEDPVDMMVGFSHFDCGRIATRHLVDQGYRRIAFLGARMDPRAQRRLAGYRSALEEAGLFDPRLVTTTPAPTSALRVGRELFRDALARAPDLDAIFCSNDDVALGALFECNRSGIAVPGRIGIVGFNDIEMMQVAFPSLTSVRTPRFEIGRRAMEMARAALASVPIASRRRSSASNCRSGKARRRRV